MKMSAIIPARGGSKGVPAKNKRMLDGMPLIAKTITSANQAASVANVYITSDDDEILDISAQFGGIPIRRPEKLSGDKASSEDALLHALDFIDKETTTLVFLQCTSPFTTAEDIDKVVETFVKKKANSALSVTEFHGFLWKSNDEGNGEGINHNFRQLRKLRQDAPIQYIETGAIYVIDIELFKKTKNRFCGKCVPVPVQTGRFEIDTEHDWKVAEALIQNDTFPNELINEHLKSIEAIVMDFDGVHTNDLVMVDQDGRESVVCSRKDGMGIELLNQRGYKLAIISKEENNVVRKRAEKLCLEVFHGIDDKAACLTRWIKKQQLKAEQVAFVGNDINDIECMNSVGLAVCPADAHETVKAIAHLVLKEKGGCGAIRELAERMLLLNDSKTLRR